MTDINDQVELCLKFELELRQYKNRLAYVKIILVMKLPRFFLYHVGEGKVRQFQSSIFHRSESFLIFS